MADKFNPQEHMMKLKGKDYLQVMWRLVWFREEHPDWSINTVMAEHDIERQAAVFRAEIIEPKTSRVISTGWGSECSKDFHDYLEKAETKAVGRALAMLGYGTQFAPDLDEGERIVDSPVDRSQPLPVEEPAKGRTTSRIEAAKKWTAEGIDTLFVLKLYGCKDLSEMKPNMINNALAHLADIKKKQDEEKGLTS